MTKEKFELLQSQAVSLPPLAKFALGMVLVFSIPPLARRVRLPGVVGLLLSGVMIGPHGDLIRRMNSANPLWGAPRSHGELLKLGIQVSQATVAKYMVRRIGTPSPTWRSFLRNEAIGIAAIDMCLVSTPLRHDHTGSRLGRLCGSMSRGIPRQRGFRNR
jgi:hypothetical protein